MGRGLGGGGILGNSGFEAVVVGAVSLAPSFGPSVLAGSGLGDVL